jgi:hypothetical protein
VITGAAGAAAGSGAVAGAGIEAGGASATGGGVLGAGGAFRIGRGCASLVGLGAGAVSWTRGALIHSTAIVAGAETISRAGA